MTATDLIQTADDPTIALAAERIRAGNLVAFPTETVYGLGADASNGQAVAKIFAAKQRPNFNPLIVHVSDISAVQTDIVLTPLAADLISNFWPGALTLVLNRSDNCGLSDLVSAGLPTVALRMPDHPIAQALLKAANRPIAAPSANRSESISPTQATHVAESLGEDAGLILDGGPCRLGLESTVVDARGETPILLRPGSLAVEAIETKVGKVLMSDGSAEKPTSPGQMLRHYAPERPLKVNATGCPADWAYLGFGTAQNGIQATDNLSPSGDLQEAAANLFAMLRALDIPKYRGIAVAPVPNTGLGLAINDRLRRATNPRPLK